MNRFLALTAVLAFLLTVSNDAFAARKKKRSSKTKVVLCVDNATGTITGRPKCSKKKETILNMETLGAMVSVQGDQGPVGPEGPQGPAGAQGAKGNTGDTGAVGPAGPQGPKGNTGGKGDTGLKGDKGEKGDIGPQGPQGIPGVLAVAQCRTVITNSSIIGELDIENGVAWCDLDEFLLTHGGITNDIDVDMIGINLLYDSGQNFPTGVQYTMGRNNPSNTNTVVVTVAAVCCPR